MLHLPGSLRLRLIGTFVVLFGVVQLALSLAAVLAGQQYLYRYFDNELIQRSDSVAARLAQWHGGLFAPDVQEIVRDETRTALFRNFFVQLRDARGQVLQRSGNLGRFELPLSASRHPGRAASDVRLSILAGQAVESLPGAGHRLRMVTRSVQTAGGQVLTLQMAASLDHVDAAVAQWRQLLLVGAGVGLLAAAVASWFVAGRAVRKIREVSALVQQVQPGQLQQRITSSDRSDEIGQMVLHVNQMLARLEAGFQAQDGFIHDASHELKTPLSALLSEAQVLKKLEPTPQQCRGFIDSVEQEVRHLARLVDSLLVLARVGDDRHPLDREVAPVNDAVEQAVDDCRGLARELGVTLALTLDQPDERQGEMMYQGDAGLVMTLVSNLVRNAVQFSPPQGRVEVEVSRCDRHAVIEVRDQGPGVPPEALGTIFDRFVQAGAPTPRRGTGLGLAIAARIARLHEGQIRVANRRTGGCVFTATLPLLAVN